MRMIVTGLALAVSLVGCATAEPAAPASKPDDGPFKYSQCMRDNGVPEFPDPQINEGGGMGLSLPEGVDKQKLEAAEAKCKQFMPNGGEPQKASPEMVEAARKMAQCMRDNGYPDFPDPDENGGIAIKGGAGMDPKDPKFQEAHKKCEQFLPKGPGGSKHDRTEG
ncbi:hypothetical protein [Kibdelosporangium aridum]|uniref:hypothetical protein n=1 Tax=Kibdelosporangium aridum TaxID=2030 RepID=UPI0006899D0C